MQTLAVVTADSNADGRQTWPARDIRRDARFYFNCQPGKNSPENNSLPWIFSLGWPKQKQECWRL